MSEKQPVLLLERLAKANPDLSREAFELITSLLSDER